MGKHLSVTIPHVGRGSTDFSWMARHLFLLREEDKVQTFLLMHLTCYFLAFWLRQTLGGTFCWRSIVSKAGWYVGQVKINSEWLFLDCRMRSKLFFFFFFLGIHSFLCTKADVFIALKSQHSSTCLKCWPNNIPAYVSLYTLDNPVLFF